MFCVLLEKNTFFLNLKKKKIKKGTAGFKMLMMKTPAAELFQPQGHRAHGRKNEQCAVFNKWCFTDSFCGENQAWRKFFWGWEQLIREIKLALSSLEWWAHFPLNWHVKYPSLHSKLGPTEGLTWPKSPCGLPLRQSSGFYLNFFSLYFCHLLFIQIKKCLGQPGIVERTAGGWNETVFKNPFQHKPRPSSLAFFFKLS